MTFNNERKVVGKIMLSTYLPMPTFTVIQKSYTLKLRNFNIKYMIYKNIN